MISFNPFSAGTAFMLMQTGWIQASLFATWSTIPNKNQSEFKGFNKQTTIKSIFRKLPSIQRVNASLARLFTAFDGNNGIRPIFNSHTVKIYGELTLAS